MKLLVFSDSHGSSRNMEEALGLHRDAEVVIHLGDGAREFEAITAEYSNERRVFLSLEGNCDMWQPLPAKPDPELLLDLAGVKALMCHGHTHGVKHGLEPYLSYAAGRGAKLALFGHTHEAFERYYPEEGIWLFNPGSISRPAYGRPSYGIITIKNGQLLTSHGEL